MLPNYKMDGRGILSQVKHEEFHKDYGEERNNYGEISHYLSFLRLGWILGNLPHPDRPMTLMDIGIGNGDFLRACKKYPAFDNLYGFDLMYDYLPEACQVGNLNDHYDIITMYDSLEHFPDLEFVHSLNCDYLVIAVPNCKYPLDDAWFEKWKHRRPNEHLHHFNFRSLTSLLLPTYHLENYTYMEDTIRYDPNNSENILTVFCRKR